MGLATSVETSGLDLRTRTHQLEAKEQARRKQCDVRFSIARRNCVFQKNYLRTGVRKMLRMGFVPARMWRGQAVGILPTKRLKLRRQMAAAAGKKESVPLSLFMEVNDLVVEEDFSLWPLFSAGGV